MYYIHPSDLNKTHTSTHHQQTATVVCDDRGLEFTIADADWTLQDIHYASPALERASQYEPCGFGAGER